MDHARQLVSVALQNAVSDQPLAPASVRGVKAAIIDLMYYRALQGEVSARRCETPQGDGRPHSRGRGRRGRRLRADDHEVPRPDGRDGRLLLRSALYYSGPYMYSETLRVNLTILASDDFGASFGRSLNLWPGSAGYTGLACGMPGKNDCGVLFSSHGVGLNFLSFSSNAVK